MHNSIENVSFYIDDILEFLLPDNIQLFTQS